MAEGLRDSSAAAGKKAVIGHFAVAALWLACALLSPANAQHRARELGIPFDGTPGRYNAITDVAGIEVGHATVITGSGKLVVGRGPARTGVTIIHPLGKATFDGVAAGRAVINGTGEWTGMNLVDEIGGFFGPIALTGSGNVGIVHQTIMDWSLSHVPADALTSRVLPVVAETLDSRLNDVFGHPLRPSDVLAAIDGAKGGTVAEGNVGGGTGMIAYGFKGGIGTASRIVTVHDKTYVVGVLVQANHGDRNDLRVAGIPVGREIQGARPEIDGHASDDTLRSQEKNSLLVVIATDAPLLPHQLQRLARRAALGIGRNGSTAGSLSGEMALAFSTSVTIPLGKPMRVPDTIADTDGSAINPLFAAAVQATEEALINQLVASRTMIGANNLRVFALPHDQLQVILERHGVLRAERGPFAPPSTR